ILYPTFNQAPPPNVKPVGLVEKSGVKLYATQIQLYDDRVLNFMGQAPQFGNANLSLSVAALLEDGDGDSIAGIENASARDDLGNILVQPQQANIIGGLYYSGSSRFPDEWNGSI